MIQAMKKGPSEKLTGVQLIKKFPLLFMGPNDHYHADKNPHRPIM
jgi:hypothetical protein